MSIAECIRTCDCAGCKWQRDRIERQRTRGCAVCSVVPPDGDYMATDEVWQEAGFAPNVIVCFECFLISLGRPVTAADFRDCTGNAPLLWALNR